MRKSWRRGGGGGRRRRITKKTEINIQIGRGVVKGTRRRSRNSRLAASATDTLDSDGDVVLPDAVRSGFKSGDVPMVWSHKWDMPIGKGKINKDKDKATFEGNFFMDTESGKEAYNLVKSMGDLQQWSFGFKVDDSEDGKLKKDGEEEQDVRYLKGLTVYEVSPVLVGANQETYTMAIKSNTELLEDIADAKAVMTTGSMNQPDPKEEEVEEAPAEEPVEQKKSAKKKK